MPPSSTLLALYLVAFTATTSSSQSNVTSSEGATCPTEFGDGKCQEDCWTWGIQAPDTCGALECCPPKSIKSYCQYLMKVEVSISSSGYGAGGFAVAPGDYPEMALVGFGPEESKSWFCGGSLLNERFVLTAAHCLEQYELGPARWVRLGELDYSKGSENFLTRDFNIVRRIPHPEFRDPVMYHDIALLELDRKAYINRRFINPVCLFTLPSVPFEDVKAAGWGRTGPAKALSTRLIEVNLTMINHSTCIESRKPSRAIPNGVDPKMMVCAGWPPGGRDTCQGDSGGPLVLNIDIYKKPHMQVGITSFGGLCTYPNSASVYTRVSHYIPWIDSIIWD